MPAPLGAQAIGPCFSALSQSPITSIAPSAEGRRDAAPGNGKEGHHGCHEVPSVTTARSSGGRLTGVEGNARITGLTGMVLLFMLAAEGATLLSIHGLISWHIGVGLALLPPVALKMASTFWRFAHYYSGDVRYRRAGPPHPILRVVGPFVYVTTAVLLISGVVVAAQGVGHGQWLLIHKLSFVAWFPFMTIHVLGHLRRAGRLSGRDLSPSQRRRVPAATIRQGLVVACLAGGLVLGLTLTSSFPSWTSGDFGRHQFCPPSATGAQKCGPPDGHH
jgi:hypothetical protein